MDTIDNLKRIRMSNKVRQFRLAKHIGITSVTLSRYENRNREMPLDVALKYAEFLGYEIRLLKK